ncbi:MAG: hypothetical protein AMXMBFR84_31280 [Candidatus Hydrogenedentota bacterium]
MASKGSELKALRPLIAQTGILPDAAALPVDRLSELPLAGSQVAVVGAVALGLLYCFLGYKTLKFVIGLTGFLLAGAVAGLIAGYLSKGEPLIMGLFALFGGGCGAAALFFLYRTGIFILGSMAVGLISHQILSVRDVEWAIWGVIGGAFAGGIVALLLERPVMTLGTAALGAWATVCGVAYFFLGPDVVQSLGEPLAMDRNRGIMVLCWAVLTLAGVLAQIATHKGRKPPSET